MDFLFKYLNIVLIASVKFFWATPYALLFKLNYIETIVMVEIGGLLGFLFYYYFFAFLLKELKLFWPNVYRVTPAIFKVSFEQWLTERRKRKLKARKFTRTNKMIVKIRDKWGMIGIIVLTPVLLSIPIGALLGTKYFRHIHGFIPWMMVSISLWGIISLLFFSIFADYH
jgi:hypothetical protein